MIRDKYIIISKISKINTILILKLNNIYPNIKTSGLLYETNQLHQLTLTKLS